MSDMLTLGGARCCVVALRRLAAGSQIGTIRDPRYDERYAGALIGCPMSEVGREKKLLDMERDRLKACVRQFPCGAWEGNIVHYKTELPQT